MRLLAQAPELLKERDALALENGALRAMLANVELNHGLADLNSAIHVVMASVSDQGTVDRLSVHTRQASKTLREMAESHQVPIPERNAKLYVALEGLARGLDQEQEALQGVPTYGIAEASIDAALVACQKARALGVVARPGGASGGSGLDG